jgi:hypothetical protein
MLLLQALYSGKGIRPNSEESFIRPEWLGPPPSTDPKSSSHSKNLACASVMMPSVSFGRRRVSRQTVKLYTRRAHCACCVQSFLGGFEFLRAYLCVKQSYTDTPDGLCVHTIAFSKPPKHDCFYSMVAFSCKNIVCPRYVSFVAQSSCELVHASRLQ